MTLSAARQPHAALKAQSIAHDDPLTEAPSHGPLQPMVRRADVSRS